MLICPFDSPLSSALYLYKVRLALRLLEAGSEFEVLSFGIRLNSVSSELSHWMKTVFQRTDQSYSTRKALPTTRGFASVNLVSPDLFIAFK